MHKFLIHRRGDDVGVATQDITTAETVTGVYMDDLSTIEVNCKGNIPLGHKVALVQLEAGADVVEYGQVIGVTTCAWSQGDYVHTHNIKTKRWQS